VVAGAHAARPLQHQRAGSSYSSNYELNTWRRRECLCNRSNTHESGRDLKDLSDWEEVELEDFAVSIKAVVAKFKGFTMIVQRSRTIFRQRYSIPRVEALQVRSWRAEDFLAGFSETTRVVPFHSASTSAKLF
jgi:hypothetical protein